MDRLHTNLKICSINVNHLRPRLQEILNFISDEKLDILFLQETLLNNNDNLNIPGFNIIRKDIDPSKRTGGVCTIIREDIKFSISSDLDQLNKHLQVIKVNLGGIGEVVFINYYQLQSEELPAEIFQIATLKFNKFILIGDLNSCHTDFGCSYTNKRGKDLFGYLHDFDLSILNNEEPTFFHRANHKPNILDLFISNFNFDHTFYIGDDVGSDHLPIHLDFSNASPESTVKLTRNMKKIDWNEFRTLMSDSIETHAITTPTNKESIDSTIDKLETIIIDKLDLLSPKSINKSKSWWTFSPEIKHKVKERRRIKRLVKLDNTPENKRQYNILNKEVRRLVNEQKQQNWKDMSKGLDVKSPSKAWRIIKTIQNSNTNPNLGIKSVKDDSGNVALNDLEKCELMANHLEKKQSLPTDNRFNHELKEDIINSLRANPPNINPIDNNNSLNQPVSVAELIKELRKCNNNSAAGADEINYKVIKSLPYNVLELLAKTYSLCLELGYFPEKFRKAEVIMLPKPKKDKSLVKNYRPVSLLSCLGKVLERVVKSRLILHLIENNLLNKFQYGFMPGKSTMEHIFHLSQDVHNTFKRKQFTIAIFLDIEGAFDTVFIPGAIHKLNSFNLPGNIIAFLSSFLTDRSFLVKVGNNKSRTVYPESGTPQGSVLSPLLFNLFTNDIPPPDNNNVRLTQYADDIAVWASGNSVKIVTKQLQNYLDKLSSWCNDWFIKINPDKTQVICFNQRKKLDNIILNLLGKPLTISQEATFLGVTFDSKLNWAAHASKITETVWRKTNVLRSLAGRDWGARGEFLIKIYKQWALPNITYACLSFANIRKTHYKKLDVIQNTIIRSALEVY